MTAATMSAPMGAIIGPLLNILTEKEWDARLRSDRTTEAATPIDPYMVWADLTDFRDFQVRGPGGVYRMPGVLTFIAELPPEVDALSAIERLNGIAGLSVPEHYKRPLPDGAHARFITVRLETDPRPAGSGESIPPLVTRFTALLDTPEFSRIQIGHPRGKADLATKAGDEAGLDLHDMDAPPVVIGILDDFCPFAHWMVRGPGNTTRIAALWDQTTFRDCEPPWARPDGFPYGRQIAATAAAPANSLNGVLRQATWDGEVEEERCYGGEFGIWTATGRSRFRRRRTHGAALLDLAAGTLSPLGRIDTIEGGIGSLECAADAASRAPVVFVQMPSEQTQISTGRWLAVNALDGIRYIQDVARRIGTAQAGAPNDPGIAINLSYGAIAGAHDGTGMFERAIDEICLANDKLAVVLAAGNAFGSDVHAERVIEPGGTGEFHCLIPPDKTFETAVEIWVPDVRHCRITVTPPDGMPPMTVDADHPLQTLGTSRGAGAPVIAALIFPRMPTQSTRRTMALLAISGTQLNRRCLYAPSGVWTVAVTNTSAASLAAEAWVERDDQLVGSVRGQWARFVEDAQSLGDDVHPNAGDDEVRARALRRPASYINQRSTFSSIATGKQILVVGGLRHRDGAVAEYSAEGAANAEGPAFSAASDVGKALPGLHVAGTFSGSFERMNGTSVAAPQVTREIANRLAAGILAKSVRDDVAAARAAGKGDSRRGPLEV